MWAQLGSSLMSLFQMGFSVMMWILLHKTCRVENTKLNSETLKFLGDPSNSVIVYQMKMHACSTSIMAMFSLLANLTRHYYGLRVIVTLKLIVLFTGILGVVLMYMKGFEITELICIDEDVLKYVVGYFIFFIANFLCTYWHFKFVGKSNYAIHLRSRRRYLNSKRAPHQNDKNAFVLAPVEEEDQI